MMTVAHRIFGGEWVACA